MVFYTVMRLAPSGIRMRMWRGLYQRMARSQTDPSFRFMNYGFTDDSELELLEGDEPDRLFIQLYNMNVRDVEMEGKEVLEIGTVLSSAAEARLRTRAHLLIGTPRATGHEGAARPIHRLRATNSCRRELEWS